MTALFVAASLVAGVVATVAILQLVRPVLGGRIVWPAFAAGALTLGVTTIVGTLTGAARLDFLIGVAAFTGPVLVLLEAAAIAAGAGRAGRILLMLLWGAVVFPGATLIPLLVTAPCVARSCAIEDFGGSLGLFVSAGAFVVLARVPAGVPLRESRGPGAILAVLVFWGAFLLWLTSLEAGFDAFLPRILLAGVVGPIAGAAGWLLTDRLRALERVPTRSLAFGFLAGMLATVPGAVSVVVPWTAVVGVLAGMAAALVHSLPLVARLGTPARWGVTVLVATGIGLLAPPVTGETIGFVFSASVGVLQSPLVAFLGVAAGAILVPAPAWTRLARSRGSSAPAPTASGAR